MGQLGLGVWQAAARLQTFCFYEPCSGGSSLSAAVSFCFCHAPRSGCRLRWATASPGRQAQRAGTLESRSPAPSRAQPERVTNPTRLWKPLVPLFALCKRRCRFS